MYFHVLLRINWLLVQTKLLITYSFMLFSHLFPKLAPLIFFGREREREREEVMGSIQKGFLLYLLVIIWARRADIRDRDSQVMTSECRLLTARGHTVKCNVLLRINWLLVQTKLLITYSFMLFSHLFPKLAPLIFFGRERERERGSDGIYSKRVLQLALLRKYFWFSETTSV